MCVCVVYASAGLFWEAVRQQIQQKYDWSHECWRKPRQSSCSRAPSTTQFDADVYRTTHQCEQLTTLCRRTLTKACYTYVATPSKNYLCAFNCVSIYISNNQVREHSEGAGCLHLICNRIDTAILECVDCSTIWSHIYNWRYIEFVMNWGGPSRGHYKYLFIWWWRIYKACVFSVNSCLLCWCWRHMARCPHSLCLHFQFIIHNCSWPQHSRYIYINIIYDAI